MLAVLSPLRAEVEPALRGLASIRGGPGQPLALPAPGQAVRFAPGPGGAALAVGWSGMGRAATEQAITALVREHGATEVLHLGVAAGIVGGLAAGEAVLCEAALCPGQPRLECRSAATELVTRLAAACAPLRRGVTVTVDALLTTSDAKRSLAIGHPGAVVGEMETYWAVATAGGLGVPITCLRVVCDRVEDALPDLSPALDAVGAPRPLRLAAHLARRPGALLALPALARAFGRAQRTLERAVQAAAG